WLHCIYRGGRPPSYAEFVSTSDRMGYSRRLMFQEIARTVRVAASPETAWSTVLDFPKVASWLSVVRDLREVEPMKRYTTVLEDRVGPFSLRADLAIDVRADADARKLRVSGSG